MRARTALILLLLGLASLGAGWFGGVAREPEVATTLARTRAAFPGLAAKLGRAREVVIAIGGKRLVIGRAGGHWGLADRGGYPVKVATLHALFAGLAGLRLRARLTRDPHLLGQLGLPAPGAVSGPGTRLALRDQAGHMLAALILGKRHVHAAGNVPGTVFIRFPKQARAWLAKGRVAAPVQAAAWLDRGLLDIAPGAIATVEVARGGELLKFARAGKGPLAMVAPAGHPPLDSGRLNTIATALRAVTFSDVLPAAKAPGRLVGTGIFTTTKGLTVTATVRRAGAFLWVGFSAAGKGAAPIEARVRGWVFRMGRWREVELVPSLAQLRSIKVPTAPPAPGPAAP